MILSIRVNNFLVYSNEVELSLKADMHIKKFTDSIFKVGNFNILKSACIYGTNNSGKTCLIRAINTIKNVLMGLVAEVPTNIFTGSNISSYGVSFIQNNKAYSYDFKFDLTIQNGYKRGFIYECMKELNIDKYGNLSEKELFIRDVDKNIYKFNDDKELTNVLSLVSNDNILVYTINSIKYPIVETFKQILRNFASSVDVLYMDNIPIEKTIDALKNNKGIKDKTIELIKMADLDIVDYKYIKGTPRGIANMPAVGNVPVPQELILQAAVAIDDMYRLTSVHRGKEVQSLTFDSTGTKKIVALASFVIDALENGRTLIIDELDSSLHFKLTRAIVALFNNELNTNAQLIFTAHDVTLLDCKNLFRKDQIWFADKDLENVYLYSLDDFNSQDDKIRSDTDLFQKYCSGVFGAIPEPDLISVLISDVKNGGN